MFRDRIEAGRRLADRLAGEPIDRPAVLAMPRGGVPVAAEVARRLGAPLDVVVVRKLGCPWQPELALGAIAEGGVRVIDRRLVDETGVTAAELDEVEARERVELERRVRRYRGDRPPVALAGRTAIVIDDGIATGSSARAAVGAARASGATRVIVAAPVAPPSTVANLSRVADAVIVVESPSVFAAIGEFYLDFRQTPDEEVVTLLEAGRSPGADDASPGDAR